MKLFDKYFQPYAEYCLRTTLSEDELKETLAKECPATGDILSLKAFKAVIGLGKTVIFSVTRMIHYILPRSSFPGIHHGGIYLFNAKMPPTGKRSCIFLSVQMGNINTWHTQFVFLLQAGGLLRLLSSGGGYFFRFYLSDCFSSFWSVAGQPELMKSPKSVRTLK